MVLILALRERPFIPNGQIPSPLFVSSVDGKGAASHSGMTVGDYILKVLHV